MEQFNFNSFIQRQQRDTSRLSRAAWNVGATHKWFKALPEDKQAERVLVWVEEALQHANDRRAERPGRVVGQL
jgi:hypothetical protein